MENIERIVDPTEDPLDKWPYFNQVSSSKEFSAAKKFVEVYVTKGKYNGELINNPENIENLRQYITDKSSRFPGASVEGVLDELKKAKVIIEPAPVPKVKEEKKKEFAETTHITLKNLKEVEVDENQRETIEANLLLEEIEKHNIFKNSDELETIYKKSIESQGNRIESEQYYYEFSDAGLIKGGKEEVHKDLEELTERKKLFENKDSSNQKGKEKIEKAKKIATITERALAYGVTELSWYGDNVSIEPVSDFDDIKRGVDDILEIRKQDEESSFMALGIDVTFRGLYSEQFKDKFFRLLDSIKKGRKTKVKYFKNHNNEMMKEFSVPKMVLYFNVEDVKDMVSILKSSKDDDKSKNNLQKINVLNQVVHSCQMLSEFAEDFQNNIFRRYVAVLNSLKELAWENDEVKQVLEGDKDDEVSSHLKKLIEEFKLNEKQIALTESDGEYED